MDPEHPLHSYTALAFVVCGAMATAFGMFSVIGTMTGAAMTVVLATDSLEAALFGVLIFLAYGVWTLACLGGGLLQLFAGKKLFAGDASPTLVWAASAAGLLYVITVYCAPFGLVSAIVGMLYASQAGPSSE